MKPLICDLPYPCLENLEKDVRSGQIISFAYATQRGELTAALQYSYHRLHMENFDKNTADLLASIAVAEMKHLEILGRTMHKLGVNPKYVQLPNTQTYYSAVAVSQSVTQQKMLTDDIQSEMNSICDYQKMLFVLKNERVSAIIQRIISDEQLHLETLKKALENIAVVAAR